MASITQVRVENVTPVRLVDLVLSGRIRLPSFQRAYRWRPSDVEDLFDSIRKSYPIGNLLLWQRPAPADRVSIGPLVLDVPEVMNALWVVDGQQRITSLVGALLAPPDVTDPRFSLYAHLPSLDFRATTHTPSGPWLPLRSAGSTQKLLRWQRENVELLGEAEYAAADALAEALRDYSIPTYVVEADDERELRHVFDRMNNYGRRLRKEEVFDALHGMQDTAQPGDLGALGDAVAAAGFGRLGERDLLRSLLALRGPDVFRDIHHEFTEDDDRRRAFSLTETVLLDVVALLRNELGIPHVRVLPYPSVIPMLAALVHRFGTPSGRSADLVRRWLWRGSALGTNPGGNVPHVRSVLRAVRGATSSTEAALALLAALPPNPARWVPDLSQVQLVRALARVNVLGLIELGPRELISQSQDLPVPNAALAPSDLLEVNSSPLLRIVPADVDHPLASTLANRLLHPPIGRDLIRRLREADSETLASHGIDDIAAAAMSAEHWIMFLKRRAELLTSTISGLVNERAEWGARDRFIAADLIGRGSLSA